MLNRRSLLAAVALGAALFMVGAHAAAPEPVRAALAPAGILRVGVYTGSPTSYVRTANGREAGLTFDMGLLLGERLGVPVRIVHFNRIALVLEAMRAGDIDFTVTNASEERYKMVDFAPTLLRLELGYLVPQGSVLANADEVDRPGVRVGVTEGSSSQSVLSQRYQSAKLMPAASLVKAADMLKANAIDAFATNKGILYELSDQVPGSRVLPGRWRVENLAIAVPKGRDAGAAWLRDFSEQLRTSAELKDMVLRAGLRGTAND